MIPYADMMNHKCPDRNCIYYLDEKSKGFVVFANRDIKKGEEISICYDQKKPLSNYDLFSRYGFIY